MSAAGGAARTLLEFGAGVSAQERWGVHELRRRLSGRKGPRALGGRPDDLAYDLARGFVVVTDMVDGPPPPKKARGAAASGAMVGTGSTPEGIDQNWVVYELRASTRTG